MFLSLLSGQAPVDMSHSWPQLWGNHSTMGADTTILAWPVQAGSQGCSQNRKCCSFFIEVDFTNKKRPDCDGVLQSLWRDWFLSPTKSIHVHLLWKQYFVELHMVLRFLKNFMLNMESLIRSL